MQNETGKLVLDHFSFFKKFYINYINYINYNYYINFILIGLQLDFTAFR